ncbi:hypothetical protein Nepgr_007524 [Nepenthes gracilis]|uniref:Uncharacterized protein n=1 Tax=Nepenthes gracilis TaxID=150966 RepID=A0AAD3XIF2_NEPGR|nr:hypothetical protein Nepgr_007524 [Nepenthes gracilis]
MGGGGAMRAAAKAAGIGVLNGGIRGVGAENPISVAAHKAVRPASATVSTDEDVKHGVLRASSQSAKTAQSVQRPIWEIDEWEFAGGEEEFVVDKVADSVPRQVFGPVPTFDEAQEATSELKDALDKIYFSPSKSSQSVDPIPAVHEHGLSVPSLPEHTDTKSCAINETAVIPSVPKHAMQAFMLLRESPAAQTVVASIASDRNVWDAVLQNEALRGYLNSETKNAEFEQPSKTSTVSSDIKGDGKSENPLMSFMEYVKNGVAEMVTKMTYFIHNLFGGSAGKGEAGAVDGFPAAAMTAGGSLMALAVMVIMVVVMKRGDNCMGSSWPTLPGFGWIRSSSDQVIWV